MDAMTRWTTVRPAALVVLPAAICTAWASPREAAADGKIFSTLDHRPWIPGQRALLVWDGQMETLVIDTEVLGGGAELAWVIPTPAVPTVAPASRGVIETCLYATGPAFVPRPLSPLECLPVVAALPAASLLLWGSKRLVNGLLALSATVLLLLVLLLPALGTARGLDEGVAKSASTVIAEGKAGEFDFTVLGGTDAAAVTDWLRSGGFHVSDAAVGVIGDLVAEGWAFVAGRRRVEGLASGIVPPPHPIVLRFPADAPIYPMRLTAADATEPLVLSLLVAAGGSASAPGLPVAASLPIVPVPAGAPPIGRRKAGEALIGLPELLSLLGSVTTLTRLEAELRPAQMVLDIRPVIGPQVMVQGERRFTRVGRWSALLLGSATSTLVFLVLGLVGAGRAWRLPTRAWLVGLGAVLGLMVGVGLASSSAREQDLAWERRLETRHGEMIGKLREIAGERAASDELFEELRGEATARRILHPLIARAMQEGATPGDWTMHRADGAIVYRWHDATGRGFDEVIVPARRER